MSADLAGTAVPSAGAARHTAVPPALGRTPLQLVPTARAGAPRTRFVALVATLLVTGLLGLLMLNTVLARNSFVLYSLSAQTRALDDSEQALQREVELLRSPQNVATRAAELGMVQAGPPAFLRLSDGAVLGATDPAGDPSATAPPTAGRKPPVIATKPSPAAKQPPVVTKPSPAPAKPSPAAAKPAPAAKAPTGPKAGTTPAPGAVR